MPISLIFVFLLVGAFAVNFIDLVIVRYLLILVLTVAALPLYLTAWTLYSHSVFDKMVNSALYPEYVDKGVYRIEKPNKN